MWELHLLDQILVALCQCRLPLITIVEMPTNVEAAAFSLAASAGGAIRAIKTTSLMTTAEGIEAMKKAAKSGYKARSRAARA
jgi:hypothetical protein